MKIGKVVILTGFAIFSLVATFSGSIAWFQALKMESTDVPFNGYSESAYFAYGDGSAEHPYGITEVRHLNNLAWLQDSGYFNKNPITHYYFELANDIDGSITDEQGNPGKFTIPPIGTETYPFYGVFSGKVAGENEIHTISNIKITNDAITQQVDPFTNKPKNVTYNQSDVNITGFFGVVGKTDTSSSYLASENAIKDVVLEDITIESKTARALTGIAAGFVNAEMSNVKVGGESSIVNSGSTTATSYTSNLSDHSLVGYTTKMLPTGQPGYDTADVGYKHTVSKFFDSTDTSSGGSGSGDEWGGSINFLDFNLRLKSQLQDASASTIQQNPTGQPSSTSTSYQTFRKYSNNYLSSTVYYGSNIMSNIVNKNPQTTRVIYNLMDEGTYTRSGREDVSDIPGTVQPLSMEDNSYTTPKSDNTGYIIGGVGNNTYENNNYNPTIRTASYEMRFIANALGDQTYNSDCINSGTNNGYTTGTAIQWPSYNQTKLEILTNSSSTYSNSNYVYIKDELDGYNQNHSPNYAYTKSDNTTPTKLGLSKYNDSRAALHSVLNGKTYIHGLHFAGSTVTYNSYVQRNNIQLLGNTMPNNYKLPKNAIDFHLQEDGIINFFAGSYYSRGTPASNKKYNSNSDNFFALYHIVRSNNDLTSSSVKRISVIYKNTNTSLSNKYVYKYSDNSYSSGTAGTQLFDLEYMNNSPVDNALYYFELPVDSGEYALGAANSSNSSYGGYLLYLDIGASGGEELEGTVTAHAVTTQTQVKFTYPSGIDFAATSAASDIDGGATLGVVIAFNAQGTTSGTTTFDVSGNTIGYSSTIQTNTSYSYCVMHVNSQAPPNENSDFTTVGTRKIVATITPSGGSATTLTFYTSSTDNYTAITSWEEGTDDELKPLVTDAILGKLKNYFATNTAIVLTRKRGSTAFTCSPSYSDATDHHRTISITATGSGDVVITSSKDADCTITVNSTSVTGNGQEIPL